ncbi:hypothetical protein GHO29_19640 [Pseudomonas helleri]|uniref:DUF2971 domain-containing protein n=1 Tax=Pseudomonas helleri TaxID=1608996 RepID=A0A7X1Y153_9PSED|nr:hypothetical protein [Pseudomonas helleri]MQU28690.1 hypothetical protein [Pseudomonas helleri]
MISEIFGAKFMPYINNENLNLDTKVFRYMDLAKFLSLIHQKTIFFARASSYEDSLEGMPTELDEYLGSDLAELLDVALNSSWPSMSPDTSEEGRRKKEDAIKKAKSNYENRTIKTIFGPQKASQFADYSSVQKAVSNWVDVSCWHTDASDVESMAMWKIYGGGSASVCVESTVGEVIRSMSIAPELNVYAGVVSYIDYRNDYVGVDEPLKFFFNKSKYYAFEKELRFVLHSTLLKDLNVPRNEFGTSVDVDPMVLIKGVMVSPAASQWFFDLIELVMKDSGYSVPVSRSKIPLRKL